MKTEWSVLPSLGHEHWLFVDGRGVPSFVRIYEKGGKVYMVQNGTRSLVKFGMWTPLKRPSTPDVVGDCGIDMYLAVMTNQPIPATAILKGDTLSKGTMQHPPVYLLTSGDESEGDPWKVHSIHSSRDSAEKAKQARYFSTAANIEEWPVDG